MTEYDWKSFLFGWDQERCGFILNSGEVIELENIHADPENSFAISEEDAAPYLERVWGIWHTHCSNNYNLSMMDYEGFLEHPELHHVIISYSGVAEYIVDNDRVINLKRRIFDG